MRAVFVVALLFAFLSFQRIQPAAISMADTLARDFLMSLSPESTKLTQLPFTDDARTLWNFVPITRRGVSLAQLSPEQAEKAMKMLKASLSDIGYRKVEQIRELEDVLFEMEGRNPIRNKEDYHFLIFGDPNPKGTWGWRYEGHHVSLNFTYHDDVLVSSSPQFLGSNPANVAEGPKKGRVLAQEEDLAFDLLNSLDEKQLKVAIIDKVAPNEIVTSNQRKVAILERKGIAYADLKPAQRKLLMKLVSVYAEVQNPAEQKRRLKRVEPDTLVFAWMGASKPGSGHYYRIQGAKFLVEFDNTQNNANHIHTVWRDFDGDFGEDTLAHHYESSPHHHH